MISVVVPVYNEEANVDELHRRICDELKKTGDPYEIIFVDDGSTDKTFEKLGALKPLRVIRMRRNFGQTSAMDAGFKASKGDIVITMDGDLQNDPSDIGKLADKLNEGYDVVSGWRVDRHDALARKILSRLANWLTFKVTGLFLHDYACAIKAYRKELFQGVHLYGEMHVFLPAYLYARGAKVTEIPVKHHERKGGVSKHYFMKAVKDISDLLTISFLSQARPLLFFATVSFISGGLGAFCALTAITLKVLGIRNFGQTPLPIVTALFLIIGFMLFMMGFLGELMIRIYNESQNKTPYIIKEVKENIS